MKKIIILSLTLLAETAAAQTLIWSKPVGADKEFKVAGYRLLYEIAPNGICDNYDNQHRPKYSVDLGEVYKYELSTDLNFQPGFTYFIAIVTYTINDVKSGNNVKAFNYVQSLISNSVCVKIRGIPTRVLIDEDGNEIFNQGEDNEKEFIDFGSGAAGTSDNGSDDYSSRIGEVDVDAQRKGREGSGTSIAANTFQNILGRARVSSESSYIGRASIASAEKYSKRNPNMGANNVKTGMANGENILLSNDGIKQSRSRRFRISNDSRNMQKNALSSDGSWTWQRRIVLITLIIAFIVFVVEKYSRQAC